MKKMLLMGFVVIFIMACGSTTALTDVPITGSSEEAVETQPIDTLVPKPADTAAPVPTKTEPPKWIELSGNGADVVDLQKWDGPAVAEISYSGGSNFAIVNYDDNGERIDLLVNTIGKYEGLIPLDFMDGERTTRLEIDAEGPWKITMKPFLPSNVNVMTSDTYQGKGDDIVYATDLDVVKAKANGDSNFVIWSYGDSGRDLVVNEIGPWEGKVIIPKGTFLLVVNAEGTWSVEKAN